MEDHLLFIDTSGNEFLRAALVPRQGRVTELVVPVHYDLSEKLLPALSRLLGKTGGKSVKKIAVVTGPGSFSGTRSGVALANALAFAWTVPVGGVKAGKVPQSLIKLWDIDFNNRPLFPQYGQPPHITKPKRK